MHKSKIKGAVGLILHTQNNKNKQKPQNKTNKNITKNNCFSRSHEICEDKDLRSALKKELSYSKKESYEYWVACASQPGDGKCMLTDSYTDIFSFILMILHFD